MKKAYVKSWVRSYLSVLLIPLFVSIFIYSAMLGILNSQIRKTEENSFSGVVNVLENSFQGAFTKIHQITFQSAYTSLLSAKSVEDIDDDKYLQIKNFLLTIKSENTYIETIALSFPHEFFISDSGSNDKTYFFAEMHQITGVTEEEISDVYYQNRDKDFVLLPCGKYTLAVIKTNFMKSDATAAVFLIDNSKFNTYVSEQLNYTECSFLVSCKENDVIKTTVGDCNPQKAGNTLVQKGMHTGFQYTYFIATSNYNSIYVPVWTVTVISVIASAIIGFIMIIKNVKRGYQPIEKLKEKLVGNEESEEGDFVLIDGSVNRLIEENRQFETQLEKNREHLVNNFLIRLIRDLPLPDTAENICREYDLFLLNCKLAVLVIESEYLYEELDKYHDSERVAKQRIIVEERRKVAVECFDESIFKKHYIIDFEKYSCLILSGDVGIPDELFIDLIRKQAKLYQQRINDVYHVAVSVYISDFVSSPQTLAKAYKHAEEARAFGKLLGSENEIISFSQIRSSKGKVSFDIRGYNTFVELLRNKDFVNAYKQLESIVETSFENLPQELLNVRLYAVIDRLMIELNKATLSFDGGFLNSLNFTGKLLSVKSVNKLLVSCKSVFDALDSYVKENPEDSTAWVSQVETYINEHYSDSSLSVGELAEKFHFSLSHFSRVFKQVNGVGVFEYIQNVRIHNAKQLLSEGMNVNDVAISVGFLDRSPFIKVFKKKEGFTPSQYRKTI